MVCTCNITLGSVFDNNNVTYASVGPPAVIELVQSKVSICACETVCHISGFNGLISYREVHPSPNLNIIYFFETSAHTLCWEPEETVIIAGEPISQDSYLVVVLPTSIQKVRLANQEHDI